MNTDLVLEKIQEMIEEFGYFSNHYGGNFTSIERLLLAHSKLDKRMKYETRINKVRKASEYIRSELQKKYSYLVPRNDAAIIEFYFADDIEIHLKM